MEVSILKRVIQEQEASRIAKIENENIIERELDKNRVLNALKYPNILIILGIRRCGKSVFSWLSLSNRKFGYINFDDEAL